MKPTRSTPLFRVRDLRASVRFYTEVLDFEPEYPDDVEYSLGNGVLDLVNGGATLMLSIHMGDGPFGVSANVHVPDVDHVYALYVARGLDVTRRPESPVHTAPVDQTWGTREFYVTDPDGNTLCFRAPIRGTA